MDKPTAKQIIDAVESGLHAGGNDTDWEAAEFSQARDLTKSAGCQWGFTSWSDVRNAICEDITMGNPIIFGGVELEPGE